MNIEVAKSDLEVALSVSGVSVDTSASDLSSHYLFRIRKDEVEILSYGPRIFSRSPLTATCDGEEGDAFTVESWRLDKWMAGARDGVLTLTSQGSGDVKVSDGRSTIRLRSLDPAKFPYWDALLDNSEEVGSVDPRKISSAFNFAKGFVSADDTAKPELCQIEAIDGVLWSTDRRALCSIEVAAIPNLNLRLPGKEVAQVIRFLSDKLTQAHDITIRSAERSAEDGGGAFAIFERPDGSYLGVAKPSSDFPRLNVDREGAGDATLTLDMGELDSGIKVLLASAPKGHESVTFSYGQDSGVVSISMPSEAGGSDEFPLSNAKVSQGENFDVDFTVDYPYLSGITDSFGLESADFLINKRGRGGFLSFKHLDEGDAANSYFTVVVWRT